MPVIIPSWYGSDWIQEALREEDIMLAGAPPGPFMLFSQPASPAALTADSQDYTLAIQISSSTDGTLDGIWFYSAPGAANLPDHIVLFAVAGQSLVHSEAAAWSGTAGSGWVQASFASPPALTAGAAYKAAVSRINANIGNWYSSTAAYFTTGPGAGGLTSGPLSAPGNAGGDGGQDTFNHASVITYPVGSNGANYWIDPVVST